MDRGDVHGFDGGHWWWWIIAFGVIILLVLAIEALLNYRPTTSERPRQALESPRGSAEQILADRFARGEIDAAEYRQRRGALRE
jgi:putative membrane protein